MSLIVSTRLHPRTLRAVTLLLEQSSIHPSTRSDAVSCGVELLERLAYQRGVPEVGEAEALEWVLERWPTTVRNVRNVKRVAALSAAATAMEVLRAAQQGEPTAQGPTEEEVREALRHYVAPTTEEGER